MLRTIFFCRLNPLKENSLPVEIRVPVPVVIQLTALTVVHLPRRLQEHHLYQGPVRLEVVAAVGPVKRMKEVTMIYQVWQGLRQQKQH
jgi:hypothetical protein